MTLIDILALLALAVGFIVLAVWVGIQQYRLWKILEDPDHPDHGAAKEAVTSDWWDDPRRPF